MAPHVVAEKGAAVKEIGSDEAAEVGGIIAESVDQHNRGVAAADAAAVAGATSAAALLHLEKLPLERDGAAVS